MKITWPGASDIKDRAGGCYTLSGDMMLVNVATFGLRLYLVHGLLIAENAEVKRGSTDPLPPPNPHAWVEVEAEDGVMAFDPVLRMAWVQEEHRRLFGAEVIRRYRADIAVDIARRKGDFGPWDRRSLTLWEIRQQAARDNPEFSQTAAIERYLTA